WNGRFISTRSALPGARPAAASARVFLTSRGSTSTRSSSRLSRALFTGRRQQDRIVTDAMAGERLAQSQPAAEHRIFAGFEDVSPHRDAAPCRAQRLPESAAP